MRFRNTEPVYPREIRELGITVPGGGEFDWPGYDPDVHGVVTGCEPLDKKKRRTSQSGGSSDDGASGDPSDPPGTTPTPDADGAPASTPAPADPSKETPR